MNAYHHLEQLRIKAHEERHNKQVHRYFASEFKIKRPKTAANLEALIEELVNRMGGKVSIISSAGRQLTKTTNVTDVIGRANRITDTTYIPSTTVRGTPDLLGCAPNGRALAIEVKFSKSDRMSEHQLKYKAIWEKAGGIFIIAKTLDDVLLVLKALEI